MALASPADILSDFPGWVTGFEPLSRDETSRVAGGRTYVKNLGSPLWQMKATTRRLSPNNLDRWRARINALENGKGTFLGYPLSRKYPIAYPRGSWPTGASFNGTSATLNAINANRKAVRISGLPAGFAFTVGDYFARGADLHQVMEDAVANGSGLTPEFEVRPHLWPGVTTGGAISVLKPACVMAIVPGSVSSDADLSGWGTVSFQAIEAR